MTTNFHTDLSAGTATTASVNTADGQLDDAITKFRDGVNSFVQVNVGTDTTLTISAGAITITRSRHIVDTEAAVATDDLTDINGGAEGDLLLLSIVNAARQVVVKHNTAKIYLASQTDFTFTAVQEQLLLVHDGTRWCEVQTRTSIVTTPYIRVEDVKAKNTPGGTSVVGWQTRTLNTETQDTANVCSLASNQITLIPGTYDIRASAPVYQSHQHHIVLWNDTDNTLALNGTSEIAATSDSSQTRSWIQGRITLASAKAFSIRHYCMAALVTYGLGIASNANDPSGAAMSEVYTIVEGWKVG
jgi:multisubunit Na+/H+ antiporter MnhE subunit